MHHATETLECARRSDRRARGDYRAGAAGGVGSFDLETNVFSTAAPQFSAVFRWPACIPDWHVDAKHRTGLAGLSAYRIEIDSRRGRSGRLRADDVVFDLGRLRGRSSPEKANC